MMSNLWERGVNYTINYFANSYSDIKEENERRGVGSPGTSG